jgi:hypothetical protein
VGQIVVWMHTIASQREAAADARIAARVDFATVKLATIAARSAVVMRRGESAHELSRRTGCEPPAERREKAANIAVERRWSPKFRDPCERTRVRVHTVLRRSMTASRVARRSPTTAKRLPRPTARIARIVREHTMHSGTRSDEPM